MRLVSSALAAAEPAFAPAAEALSQGGSTDPFLASGGSRPERMSVAVDAQAGEAVTGSTLVGRVSSPGDPS